MWNEAVKQDKGGGGIESNHLLSPLALTSALGIAFLGAGDATAQQIDDTLGLDRLTYRNPHLHLHQVAKDTAASASSKQQQQQFYSSEQSHAVYFNAGGAGYGKVRDVFRARLDTLYGASLVSNISQLTPDSSSSSPQSQLVKNIKSPFAIVSTAVLNVHLFIFI